MLTEAWQNLANSALLFAPRLITSLVVFVLFWAAGVAAKGIIGRLCKARNLDLDLTQMFGRAAKITLLALGAVTALGTLGIDVTALVAGLGLAGFALGFALKDIISNTLAGILIIMYKPFRRNDVISVSSFKGTVMKVDLRYTVLDAEGKEVFVPNSLLFSNAITVQRAQKVEKNGQNAGSDSE